MLILGLALLAGGIGVLVGFRDDLGLRPPGPRRWLAYGTAGAMGLAALLWHPVPRTRTRTRSRSRSGRAAAGRAAVPAEPAPAARDAPHTEVIRDPVTWLPSRPRAVGRAAVPPPGTARR